MANPLETPQINEFGACLRRPSRKLNMPAFQVDRLDEDGPQPGVQGEFTALHDRARLDGKIPLTIPAVVRHVVGTPVHLIGVGSLASWTFASIGPYLRFKPLLCGFFRRVQECEFSQADTFSLGASGCFACHDLLLF